MSPVLPGTPSPEGNPLVKSLYGTGTGKIAQRISANRVVVPIAPWGAVRLRANISLAAVLNIAFSMDGSIVVGPRVRATGTLTVDAIPTDTNTCTVDTKVYTFQTTLTDVDGNVFKGASAEAAIDNLVAAITLDPAGAGTQYAASMTLHPTVTAVKATASTMTATAKSGGTSGNSIATTETFTSGGSVWGAVNLEGGVDSEIAGDEAALAANVESVIDISATEHKGEPWLLVDLAGLTAAADVTHFSAMGDSY